MARAAGARVVNEAVELVPLADLSPHPENPRQGDVGAIHESIRHNGFYGTIVCQRSTGRILAGNHRYLAAKEAGLDALPVAWVEVDDEQARRILLVDNRTNDLASYDDEALAELLAEINAEAGTLEGTGYDGNDLDRLLRDLGLLGAEEEADAIPEAPAEPKSKRGEVYELGRHRLMCGDATSEADVAALLGGGTPNLMVTDPPYGVDYDPSWRQRAAEEGRLAYAPSRVGEVQHDDRADWSAAFRLFSGDIIYCWHAGLYATETQAALSAVGFEVRSQIIWAKPHFPISRGHYHWRHEPCWYAVRKGASAAWIGDRKQTTLWEETLGSVGPAAENPHGTAKPLGLMGRPLCNHEGDVYDPFVGSGTTLIAAERQGRTCYAMEIDPRYCDVARQRYANFVGEERLAP